jgi:hypothetical protein
MSPIAPVTVAMPSPQPVSITIPTASVSPSSVTIDPLADISPVTPVTSQIIVPVTLQASEVETVSSANETDAAEYSETQIPDWLKAATESSSEASVDISDETHTEAYTEAYEETPTEMATESATEILATETLQPVISHENEIATPELETYASWENTPSIESPISDIHEVAEAKIGELSTGLDDESLERAAATLSEKQYIAPASNDLPDWLKSINTSTTEVINTEATAPTDLSPLIE